jgi:hypothetical protein
MKGNTAPQVTTLRIGISPKTKRTAARLARDRGIGLNELFLELFKAIIKKQKSSECCAVKAKTKKVPVTMRAAPAAKP